MIFSTNNCIYSYYVLFKELAKRVSAKWEDIILLNDFMVSYAAKCRITGGTEDYCARFWSLHSVVTMGTVSRLAGGIGLHCEYLRPLNLQSSRPPVALIRKQWRRHDCGWRKRSSQLKRIWLTPTWENTTAGNDLRRGTCLCVACLSWTVWRTPSCIVHGPRTNGFSLTMHT